MGSPYITQAALELLGSRNILPQPSKLPRFHTRTTTPGSLNTLVKGKINNLGGKSWTYALKGEFAFGFGFGDGTQM